jgi:hypothetical protein
MADRALGGETYSVFQRHGRSQGLSERCTVKKQSLRLRVRPYWLHWESRRDCVVLSGFLCIFP